MKQRAEYGLPAVAVGKVQVKENSVKERRVELDQGLLQQGGRNQPEMGPRVGLQLPLDPLAVHGVVLDEQDADFRFSGFHGNLLWGGVSMASIIEKESVHGNPPLANAGLAQTVCVAGSCGVR